MTDWMGEKLIKTPILSPQTPSSQQCPGDFVSPSNEYKNFSIHQSSSLGSLKSSFCGFFSALFEKIFNFLFSCCFKKKTAAPNSHIPIQNPPKSSAQIPPLASKTAQNTSASSTTTTTTHLEKGGQQTVQKIGIKNLPKSPNTPPITTSPTTTTHLTNDPIVETGTPVNLMWEENSCYLNSSLQLLAHAPRLREKVDSTIPKSVKDFLNQYDQLSAHNPEQQSLFSIHLLQELVPPDEQGDQFDAVEILPCLLGGDNGPTPYYDDDVESLHNRLFQTIRLESLAESNPSKEISADDFATELHTRCSSDHPDFLLTHCFNLKSTADAAGAFGGKVDLKIHIPLQLENGLVLKGAILHHNELSGNGGHFTSIVKRAGQFWECDDISKLVKPISEEEASRKMLACTPCILYYERP